MHHGEETKTEEPESDVAHARTHTHTHTHTHTLTHKFLVPSKAVAADEISIIGYHRVRVHSTILFGADVKGKKRKKPYLPAAVTHGMHMCVDILLRA